MECTCTQTDVDATDARGCAEHDPRTRRSLMLIALSNLAERAQDYAIRDSLANYAELVFARHEAADLGADDIDMERAEAEGQRNAGTRPTDEWEHVA